MDEAVVVPVGLGACEIQVARHSSVSTSRRLAFCAAALREQAWVRDAVPGLISLLVEWQPGAIQAAACAQELLAQWQASDGQAVSGSCHHIPVIYDGEDLAAVAAYCGLTTAEVISRHSAPEYLVACIGFQPHFPYLLGLDEALQVPRRDEPRVRVPAGSVAIAGKQAAIYPSATPGGWHLLGHCDPAHCLPLAAGDSLRFEVA